MLLTLAIRSPTNTSILTLISYFSGVSLTAFAKDDRECDQNLELIQILQALIALK